MSDSRTTKQKFTYLKSPHSIVVHRVYGYRGRKGETTACGIVVPDSWWTAFYNRLEHSRCRRCDPSAKL